jgi:NAD(P)-dependent dehydrogenase (short-subunit alcohol dehydrogenase family)
MKNTVVTGANRGIGLALARFAKERGDHVLAVCRSSSPELDALGVEVITGVDVTDPAGLTRLTTAVGDRPIHCLISNAGMLIHVGLQNLDVAAIRQQFEVNALGPLQVTAALQHRFERGSKIGIITSRMGSIGDNASGSHYGYRMSKAALNIAGVSIARDLAPRGVAVAIIHPGMINTDMLRSLGHHGLEPVDAARGIFARLDELTLETSGGFWHMNGERLPW